MNAKNRDSTDDPGAGKRRDRLDEKKIKDLELAGGVEGGMEAGSAGGPSQSDAEAAAKEARGKGRRDC